MASQRFDYHYAQIYIPEDAEYPGKDGYRSDSRDINKQDLRIVQDFISSFPKKLPQATFLLPSTASTVTLTKWQKFSQIKGIKKKRKEIWDCEQENFVPSWGRFAPKKTGISEYYGEIEQKADENETKTRTKKKKQKGTEKRTCTNERFLKRY